MPPNLGGFFMVRSYYPSECHADYFDFERIEALKPAIEACGISTLSQSPMLGFHKQMDNRIKLLEEILSFRMQGVEFDNGDMYVDGHKAASDVRDEFVSVTEKLMDELAQCYNVLPQLDINNTIDHRPEGDEKWFLENDKTVTQFCRKLAAERPLKDIRDKLLDLVGLGGKSAADKGKDTRDYLAAAFPELNAWERAGADASSAGMVVAGFENQKELTKMQLDSQKEIAEMKNKT